MGKLIHPLMLGVFLPVAAMAQSLVPPTNGTAKPAEAPASPEESEAAPAEKRGAPAIDQPSRFAGDNVTGYVEAISAVFSIRSRTTDPFGLVQDLTARNEKPKVAKNNQARAAAIPTVPYGTIVSQIRVTTVAPAEESFMVGMRNFKKGDRFPLAYHARSYPSQIVAVSAKQIVLRNLENGETGTINLDLMPPGMSKGDVRLLAPGMQPAKADAPLEIESDTPASPGITN